ncbi:peptide deformylase [Radicibacter daui]|uniref:peptide deformylase n=1 Tax=Radicibacter daui TaxID=3064829 RepID=UPI004046E96C
MAQLPIVRMGHPVLRQRAAEEARIPSEDLPALVADMIETMGAESGVGLAAPQIGLARRIIVYRVPAARQAGEAAPDSGLEAPRALINPVLEPVGDEVVAGWEGCLSMPGLRGIVPRWNSVRFSGVDVEGKPVEGIASGFHARVLQHEVDHLDGVLYIDRMEDFASLTYMEEWHHHLAPSAVQNAGLADGDKGE